MSVISESGKQALRDYKYKSVVKGWLDSNIMNEWWEFVVSFCPLSVAPNVITFTATLQFLSCCLFLSTRCPDLMQCVDPWIYYMLTISLFIYQTLDAIDGKQARRTKQSSPLGQLFDHGNDAFVTTPLMVCGCCASQIGGWKWVALMMTTWGIFFMLNWRARHVGIMNFGIFSVTESQLVGMAIFLCTGALGCEIWNVSLFGSSVSANDLVIGFIVLMGFWTMYGEYVAVQDHYRISGQSDPGQIYELIHFALFVTAFGSWFHCDVLSIWPWTYCWIATIVFCGIIHRLIVADVTHMDTTKWYRLLDPLIVIIAVSGYEIMNGVQTDKSLMNSPYMVYGILVYVVVFWTNYVVRVIDDITTTLGIRLFVITPPKTD